MIYKVSLSVQRVDREICLAVHVVDRQVEFQPEDLSKTLQMVAFSFSRIW
jgi:hypothetical protein